MKIKYVDLHTSPCHKVYYLITDEDMEVVTTAIATVIPVFIMTVTFTNTITSRNTRHS